MNYPFPWHVETVYDKGDESVDIGPSTTYYVVDANDVTICEMVNEKEARLIAEAPNMLTLLLSMQDYIQTVGALTISPGSHVNGLIKGCLDAAMEAH